jgi:hypothetical protein
VNRYSVCGCKRPKVIYRYTVLMSIYKYVVGLINTRFYRSTEQHSFAFALTKSSFKLYHILSIALSLPFCLPLQYSVTFICIHNCFSTIWRYQRDNQKPLIKHIWWHFQLCNIPWLSLGIDWWIRIPVTQMIAYQSPNKSNTTDATAEAGTAYPSKIHTGC